MIPGVQVLSDDSFEELVGRAVQGCCEDSQAVSQARVDADKLLRVTGWHRDTLADTLFFG